MTLSMEQVEATELWLIRHAETVDNQAGIVQDSRSPLSERGHAQARFLAERLHGQSFAMLFSSTATRAMETAKYVSNSVGVDLQEDDRLREIDLGSWVGLSRQERAQRYPEEWAAFQRRDPDIQFGGGESFTDMQRRVVSAIEAGTRVSSGGPVSWPAGRRIVGVLASGPP